MRLENRVTVRASAVMVWAALVGDAASERFQPTRVAPESRPGPPNTISAGRDLQTRIEIIDCVPLEHLTTRFSQNGMTGQSTYKLAELDGTTQLVHTLDLQATAAGTILGWIMVPGLKLDLLRIKSRAERAERKSAA